MFQAFISFLQVAFEPNPKQAEDLNNLAASYSSCGIKVVVYMAGVGHKNSKSKFAPFNSLLSSVVGLSLISMTL